MHFDHRFTVFQFVSLRDRLAGQLALLADRYKTGGQLVRHRAAQDEAPCLKPHDLVDPYTT